MEQGNYISEEENRISEGYSALDAAWHSDHHNFEEHFHHYLYDLKRAKLADAPAVNNFPPEGAIPIRPVPPVDTLPPVTPVPPIGVLPQITPEMPVGQLLPVAPAICPFRCPRNIPTNVVVKLQEMLDDMESAKSRLKFLAGQSRLANLSGALSRLAVTQARASVLARTFFRDVTGLRPLDCASDREERGAPGEVLLRRLVLDLTALVEKLRALSRWFARFGASCRLDEIVKLVSGIAWEAEKLAKG